MAYTFKYGDRPLDGITIQRAVGRGGFGEVYYALTDSGKQVAVKYLRENPEVELRGIAQVMNLKSPHLITIYDVRRNAEGEPFVIMEYVSGPSLRDLLNAHPDGLGPQKAAYFLQGIAAGLSYLHERGIVHRDLKPGNIFYDDGYVKIGDYGLSKHISVSRHSGNTVSVGTVHYMAPEIGSGSYSKAIDIYALGVILYEMLTGRLPFTGSSFGEILMRHLKDRPDLAGIDEPFRSVIAKALAKNPDDRFADVNEMVDAVMRSESISASIASFDHTALSRVPRCEDDDPDRTRTSPAHRDVPTLDVRAVQPPPVPPADARAARGSGPAPDALPQGIRANWAHAVVLLMLTVAASVGLGVAFGGELAGDVAVTTALGLIGAVAGALIAHLTLLPRVLVTGGVLPRFVFAATACTLMSPALAAGFDTAPVLGRTLLTLPIVLAVFDWGRRLERGRRGQVRTADAVGASVVGLLAGGVLEGEPMFSALLAAVFSLLAQSAATMWPLPRRSVPARRGRARRRHAAATPLDDAWQRADEAFERAGRPMDKAFASDRHAAPPPADPAGTPPIEPKRSLPVRIGRAVLATVAGLLLVAGLTTALLYHSRGAMQVRAGDTAVVVGKGLVVVSQHGRIRQVTQVPRAVVFIPIGLGCALLMLLRRRDGAAHFLRACLAGGAALLAAMLALGPASDSMAQACQGRWDALDTAAQLQVLRIGMLAVAALVLLLYPRRRRPRPIVI